MWLSSVSFQCSAMCIYSALLCVLLFSAVSYSLYVFPLLCSVSACCSVSRLHVSRCHPPVGTRTIVWHRSRPIRHCNIISFVSPLLFLPVLILLLSCLVAPSPLHCIRAWSRKSLAEKSRLHSAYFSSASYMHCLFPRTQDSSLALEMSGIRQFWPESKRFGLTARVPFISQSSVTLAGYKSLC